MQTLRPVRFVVGANGQALAYLCARDKEDEAKDALRETL
jgi:hypothetical protein